MLCCAELTDEGVEMVVEVTVDAFMRTTHPNSACTSSSGEGALLAAVFRNVADETLDL